MKGALGILLVSCVLLGSCSTRAGGENATRSALTSGYASVLAAHDSDGDERLGRAEVEAMIELMFPKNILAVSHFAELRDWLVADYSAQDADKDGYLTLSELLKGPIAAFECKDVNRDGRLTRPETEGGMSRCASEETYSRVGFISEPESK
jgi:hypothetical protein